MLADHDQRIAVFEPSRERTDLMRMKLALLAVLALAGAVLAAGCGGSGGGISTGTAPPLKTLAPTAADGRHADASWPAYGRDTARSGVAAAAAPAGRLSIAWRARLD